MPLLNKQSFHPNPIPDNLNPDDEVFYHELTNEIFTSHDAFVDRFLFCNSLIWTCSRTGKSGLTYKEALDSEQHVARRYKRKRKDKAEQKQPQQTEEKSKTNESEAVPTGEPVKKKKKKYPYDPNKYAKIAIPDGFDPNLLTPTGKIDGRKLKSKANKQLADELLASALAAKNNSSPGKRGRSKKKEEEARRKEEEAKKKEEEAKKKAQTQAELAKERELEAKRKKEAAALAKQLERQKKEEERKKAAAFLQNWDKKCEDLERDDLRRLPQPVPINCDIPEKLFGDAIFILESLFNLHELYDIKEIFPEGLSYDILEEILIERHDEGHLGTLVQYLLRLIFDYQPTSEGYGLDDTGVTKDENNANQTATSDKHETDHSKQSNHVKQENHHDADGANENGLHDHSSEQDEDDENEDKEVKMNDLIGSAIKAAREVKMSLSKPLPEMEINTENVTEILRLHLLQSGSFPKGRTIYNGWYSSREDPGLWLCMQEPDLIKKLENVTIYELEMDERIKILHTLIYQLFSFIRTRAYIEKASDSLTELRKEYRKEAAEFAKWDRENCVKRMWPPKRKSDQITTNNSNEKSNGDQTNIKSDLNNHNSNPCSIDGDVECDNYRAYNNDKDSASNNNQQLKSCLKSNGLNSTTTTTEAKEVQAAGQDEMDDGTNHHKKKITFKTSVNGTIVNGEAVDFHDIDEDERNQQNNGAGDGPEQTFEELERAYQQNLVDYEDYQRERAIRHEQLNTILLAIRKSLRETQSVYGVHPIGRDRAYRRYWIFQSLPGLFVEEDEEYVGRCLPEATPLESTYKKLFNKDNPLMHPIEADLIRTKTCDVACSTKAGKTEESPEPTDEVEMDENDPEMKNNLNKHPDSSEEHKLNGESPPSENGCESSGVYTEEMNYCTGDESSCAIHGLKRPKVPRWWFYNTPESIDSLVESLNKRGSRESELQDLLSVESSLIKGWVAECPAFKLNKDILEQSGIRRSRRLKTKGSKRRGGRYERD